MNYFIEVLVRWTEVRTKSTGNDEDAKLKRLLGAEEASEHPGHEIHYEYTEMTLDVYDILRFNRSGSPDHTTLTMKDGNTYVIHMPYSFFLDSYQEITGRTITMLQWIPELDEPTEEEFG